MLASVICKLIGAIVVCLLLMSTASGLSYINIDDQRLLADADLVIEARVLKRHVSDSGHRAPAFTYYDLQLIESFKGLSVSNVVRLQVPGVHAQDGYGWRVEAAPRLRADDTVLLFLQRAGPDTWRLPHLGLSAFRLHSHHGESVWRNLLGHAHDEAKGFNQRYQLARDAQAFRDWLRFGHNGVMDESDYLIPVLAPLLDSARHVHSKDESPPRRGRWLRFDQGKDVHWFSLDEQQLDPDIDQGRVVQRALASWTNHASSQVRFRFGGFVDREQARAINDSELNSDVSGVGVVLWADPFGNDPTVDPYSCPGTGLFGWASWLPEEDEDGQAAVHDHQGTEYESIRLVRVVVNQNAECVLNGPNGSGLNAEELIAHEMGHGLGFAHSCENEEKEALGIPACNNPDTSAERNQALMRYTLREDIGANLGQFDRDRLVAVYPRSAGAPVYLLSAGFEGDGRGTVELSYMVDGETQECTAPCDVLDKPDTQVKISADAQQDSVLLDWTGDCGGLRGNPITPAIGQGRDCAARFGQFSEDQALIEVMRPDCGVSISPDHWRTIIANEDRLELEIVPDEGFDVVLTGNCFHSRIDDSDTWEIEPISSLSCTVQVSLQGDGAPSCDDLFTDRFESAGQ